MIDLSHEGSLKFWYEYKDPIIYKVIVYMESVEDWTIDQDPILENKLKQLGAALDVVGGVDLSHEMEIIKLCTHLKASRTLRLLQALDTAHPGSASKLLTFAERVSSNSSNKSTADLFLKRNIIFERLRLIARIFSPDRLALVQEALEDEGLV